MSRLADRLLLEPEGSWVADATVLDVSAVFAFVGESVEGKGGEDLAQLPCARPPWNRTFVEFLADGVRMGASFDCDDEDENGARFLFRCFAWWPSDDLLVRFTPNAGSLVFDRAGRWDGDRDYHESPKWTADLTMCNDNMVAWCIFAFSLAHCRNVQLRPVEHDEKLQRARQKRGKLPLLRYEVLEIGAVVSLADDLMRQHPGMTRRQACLHIVRAHPMRTRRGAIVLRREHLRGNPAKGLKLKDYKLAPPPESREPSA